jgi:hypothetical protein
LNKKEVIRRSEHNMSEKKKLPIAPFYVVGSKDPIREFDNEMYVGYRYLQYKSAAKGIVKDLNEEGYDARITDPEYTTPHGVPVYIVWMKRTDEIKYGKKMRALLEAEFKRNEVKRPQKPRLGKKVGMQETEIISRNPYEGL